MRARARSSGTAPTIKAQTLIVVQAFQPNDEGEIVPAMQPMEMPDERRAIARAKELRCPTRASLLGPGRATKLAAAPAHQRVA